MMPDKSRYISQDPIKRARQLANLRQSTHIGRPKLKRMGEHAKNPFHPDYKNDICRYLEDHYYLDDKTRVILEPWQRERIFIPLMQKNEAGMSSYTLGLVMMPKKTVKAKWHPCLLTISCSTMKITVKY
jgi:hypothetical protein